MFSSTSFWLVLIATLVGYWLLPALVRTWFLGIAAFLFLFVSQDPLSAAAATFLAFALYWLAPLATERGSRKIGVLPLLVLALLAVLFFGKYLPQFTSRGGDAAQIAIPLGISYFTFKLIHYAVEVARGAMPKHGLGDFLCYILLFPIFPAGPIERFDHFLANRQREWSWDLALEGLTRICHGLIKRFALVEVILSPMFGATSDFTLLLSQLDSLPFYRVWWFLILTYLTAYLDFSAYSDIAIGASRLFGIRIMENFNLPIASTSISDFWRRWHMTLAGWCQSYIYMPLIGISRNPYLAAYATFVTMGVWHAASWHWVAWGLYHATGITVHNAWVRWTRRKRRKSTRSTVEVALGWAATFLFVCGGYAFTAGHGKASIVDSFRVLGRAVGVGGLFG